MAGPADKIQRPVALPWAPYYGDLSPATASGDRVEAIDLKIAAGMNITRDSFRDASPAIARARRQLDPQLSAFGLPYDPHPSIPEEDRGHFEEEHLVAVAVALDVLATTLSVIEATPAVLQQLTQALVFVGQLGGLDEVRLEGLLAFADTPAAAHRARLSRALAECQARAAGVRRGGGSSSEEEVTNTTPSSVHQALGDLIRTAKLAVRESVLLLQAQEAIDYKQA